jgi:hypothetical protein
MLTLYKKYLSILILLFTITCKGQYTTNVIKSLLYQRIDNLSNFEGIYIIKNVDIKSVPQCNEQNIIINDTIAIIEENNNLNVYSINDAQIIGKITLKYENGIYGTLNTSGFSNYPDCKITHLLWYAEYQMHETPHYSIPRNITNAINYQKSICGCPEYLKEYVYHLCNIRLVYNLEKIFPNENEPPPNQVSKGTGVIISKDGIVLTNKHVLSKSQEYEWKYDGWKIKQNIRKIKYSDIYTSITTTINNKEYQLAPIDMKYLWKTNTGKTIEQSLGIEVIDYEDYIHYLADDYDEDLILLQIINPPPDLSSVIIDTSKISLGTEVYTLGYPLSYALGSNLIYTNGYYSSSKAIEKLNIYNMGINPGNSGGGIFDKSSGNLIGITTSRLNDDNIGIKTEGLSFGTNLSYFISLIKNPNIKLQPMGLSEYDLIGTNKKTNYIWDTNKSLSTIKYPPKILVRDNTFKPIISKSNNEKATIQIIAR